MASQHIKTNGNPAELLFVKVIEIFFFSIIITTLICSYSYNDVLVLRG